MPRKPALLLSLLNLMLRPIAGQTPAPLNQHVALQQHSPAHDREAWRAYWQAQGQPWRTEPEIDMKRQRDLTERCAIVPDIEQGIHPFKGMKLSRADVEWLLSTHENGRGPIDWNDESQRSREGLDLRGADLRKVDLQRLPLAHLRCGLSKNEQLQATEEQCFMARAHMEGVILEGAQLQEADFHNVWLEGANLVRAQLQRADLTDAKLQRANLTGIQLQQADLKVARLEETILYKAQLQGANCSHARLDGADLHDAQVKEADFRETKLQEANLRNVMLSSQHHIGPLLANVQWTDVNLSVVNWSQGGMLGDEQRIQQKLINGQKKDRIQHLSEYGNAVRANHQLAVALQNQGLDEEAPRFAYRAQVLRRKTLWIQRKLGRWLFSMFLALLTGYGYRMWCILVAYAIIISLCAAAYFVIGIYYAPHLTLFQAFLESITAFHGRVFYELFTPDTPQIWVTAFEAIAGLVIESVFIAMLTQRFFGR